MALSAKVSSGMCRMLLMDDGHQKVGKVTGSKKLNKIDLYRYNLYYNCFEVKKKVGQRCAY